jgi:hypothetical protein
MANLAPDSTEQAVRTAQEEFDRAELEADRETLERLITEDFASIGPKGFLLTKAEWIDRHRHFTYHALDTSEVDIRLYDRAAIVRNVQRNRATYDGQDSEISVRVSQTWVLQGDRWRLAGIQFSPLAAG